MLDFLKTMPDMTNTPEITMEDKPKINMSQRIRDYKAANPDATAKQVADAVGATTVYVYQVLSVPAKKDKKAKAVKKQEVVLTSKHKTDGFAIGVTQPHYWVISALASGKKTTRTAILQGIIDQYIRDVLTEANQNGSAV
jgi:hypothetical protein